MSAILAACLADDEHDWVVLVDERDRPVRLRRARARCCSARRSSIPSRGSPPSARSTRRCGGWARARSSSQDAHGCYAGVVRSERLLSALAG